MHERPRSKQGAGSCQSKQPDGTVRSKASHARTTTQRQASNSAAEANIHAHKQIAGNVAHCVLDPTFIILTKTTRPHDTNTDFSDHQKQMLFSRVRLTLKVVPRSRSHSVFNKKTSRSKSRHLIFGRSGLVRFLFSVFAF